MRTRAAAQALAACLRAGRPQRARRRAPPTLRRWVLAAHEAAVNACVYDVVDRFGGTFSAEHGIGRLKRGDLAARKAAPAVAMMRAIKAALDPQGVLNPGVLLPD